jgi:uncharacterized phiE125 gp8 family phage protein
VITTVTARDATLPVSLNEAKEHLRVIDDALDGDVEGKLAAAVAYCEAVSGRSLRKTHTLTQSYCTWPTGPVKFDREPVSAITHVKYYDANGTLQTLTSTKYRLHASSESAAHLEWDDTFDSPSLDVRDNAVVITYTAGYTTIAAVPPMAKQATLLTLDLLYGNLEGRQFDACEKARDALLNALSWGAYR